MKTATAADHDALDAHFAALDLSDDADYARFLTAHASAFLPVEAALAASGADSLPGWSEGQRSDALLADLAALGLAIPNPQQPPAYDTRAAMLGGLYVLEGSRLGGKLLRRRLRPDQPSAFLSCDNGLAWRSVVAHLEQMLGTTVEQEQAGSSAQATFACFASAARKFGVVSV